MYVSGPTTSTVGIRFLGWEPWGRSDWIGVPAAGGIRSLAVAAAIRRNTIVAPMSSSSSRPGGVRDDPRSEQLLLDRVLRGSVSGVNGFFAQYAPWLRRRGRGRLPQWARSGATTSDLVQDVLHQTYKRLDWFESKHVSAMRAYLRNALENRVRDELRRATRRLNINRTLVPHERSQPFEDAAPQYQHLRNEEMWIRYRDGLKALAKRDRRLIVGRAELGYSYKQLAAIEGMPTADAARKAFKRAVIRLSTAMPNED